MDSERKNEIPYRHVVAIPYPGGGHVNPMMNFCKFLASKADILITFVVTEEWLGFIGSAPKPDNIQLRSIPNVIPSELVRRLDLAGFFDAVLTKMEAPIEQLLHKLETPATAIVADTFMSCAVAIGNRRNIPVASLWTMSPSVFLVLYHFDVVEKNVKFPVDLTERGGEYLDCIPGISLMRLMDFPTIFTWNKKALGLQLESFSWLRKAQCLLLTSFYELDIKLIDILKETLPFPVYTIGPFIPHFTTLEDKDTITSQSDDINYFKWLDSQPILSVLYVSWGSFLSISSEEMDEIAAGLRDSQVRFLWVGRENASHLQEVCGEMGLVVPWCDQLRVLCHPSIGGFLTHCGWNSTLEAVFSGVPMLTFPLVFDQDPNSKFIVDDLKIGLRVKDVGAKEMVKREEIARVVGMFMDLDGDESKEMRKRVKEMRETCLRALEKEGSSQRNLDDFITNFFVM